MQLKEFSLISPVIESADVFQAIETVIPPDIIEQTIGNTDSLEERKRKLPVPASRQFGDRDEPVVIGFNGNGLEKSRQRFEQTVDKTGAVLESTKQLVNY